MGLLKENQDDQDNQDMGRTFDATVRRASSDLSFMAMSSVAISLHRLD